MRLTTIVSCALLVLAACNQRTKSADPAPTTSAVGTTPRVAAAQGSEGALRLGSPIESATPSVPLRDVAKDPRAFLGKTFATTGTVTAVCQHMGCWMELKDDASEAHVKMAGHAFFVPKTSSGRKARVLAKLAKAEETNACDGAEHEGMSAASAASDGKPLKKGCRAEAEEQLGRPLAKLELVAEGVELM